MKQYKNGAGNTDNNLKPRSGQAKALRKNKGTNRKQQASRAPSNQDPTAPKGDGLNEIRGKRPRRALAADLAKRRERSGNAVTTTRAAPNDEMTSTNGNTTNTIKTE